MTPRHRSILALGVLLAALVALQAARYRPSEPFFNGDETRHVMTGVFVRDALVAKPLSDPKGFAVRYYRQYPALGLLVWPPLFYGIEGVTMLAFGPSVLVAKLLVAVFSGIAAVFLFALVRRDFGDRIALLSVAFFELSPMIFSYSRQVMLEMPALAAALAALYYFTRYVEREKTRHLALAVAATSCAALIRFDSAFLAPVFLLILVGRGRLALVRRPAVWIAVASAACVVGPVWWISAREIGWVHLDSVRQSPAGSTFWTMLKALAYYPSVIPQQIGWWVLLPAVLGIFPGARRIRGPRGVFIALLIGVYGVFTPIGEREVRHTIWWIPAFAFFAALGVERAAGWVRQAPLRLALTAVLVCGAAWSAARNPAPFVEGYGEAAAYVLAHSTSGSVLFDSFLNGNFVYQMRLRDPGRRMSVLRGDKLLYAVVGDPSVAYREFARTDEDILRILFDHDPELIVVEDPQIYFQMPMANQFLRLLRDRPDRFRLETQIPIRSNFPYFLGKELRIYRNLVRNPHPPATIEMPAFGMPANLVGHSF